jgi:hypothetical protein
VRPILWSQVLAEREKLGTAPFHHSPRYGLVLAREDWMIAVSSMLLLELGGTESVKVRLGVYDDLRAVPASGALMHQAGGVAMLALPRAGATLAELLLFVRAGVYAEGTLRDGQPVGMIGLTARYDLLAL